MRVLARRRVWRTERGRGVMLNEVKHLILVQSAESSKGIRFFASLRMTTLCLLAAGKPSFGRQGRQVPLPSCLGFG